MSVFNKNGAYDRAIAMVTAGLQSGVIKLDGPDYSVPGDKRMVSDAAYLNGSINLLAANLSAEKI